MSAADRIAQIRARVEAATPGPWGWFPGPLSPAPKYLDSGTEEGGYTGVISCAALTYPAKPDADFIAHARADIPALLAAVEAVLALHAPREQAVLSDPDCLREECGHEGACPLTGSVTVCAACWAVAEESYPYFCEEGVPDEVLHPCATAQRIEGALA